MTVLKTGVGYRGTSDQMVKTTISRSTDRVMFVPFPAMAVHQKWRTPSPSGRDSLLRRSLEYQMRKFRSTNLVNSTRFLTRRHQEKEVPMTSLTIGVVIQTVRSHRATKTRHLTDPEMFAPSHVTASRQVRSHRKVIGTASRTVVRSHRATKTSHLTDQAMFVLSHVTASRQVRSHLKVIGIASRTVV
jgi:hypothetical protein